jgi:signal transduction histidine kinase
VTSFLTKVKIIMIIAAPIYLLIAVLGGLLIAKKALQPISKITSTASEIEKGDLSLRIEDIDTQDEVGHLANTFNNMLEHLEVSFRRERQFSSEASHELRTPVSIIMAYSEALIANQNRKNECSEEEMKSLELIYSEVEVCNTATCHVLEKCGFEKEGLLRHRMQIGKNLVNCYSYSKLNSD